MQVVNDLRHRPFVRRGAGPKAGVYPCRAGYRRARQAKARLSSDGIDRAQQGRTSFCHLRQARIDVGWKLRERHVARSLQARLIPNFSSRYCKVRKVIPSNCAARVMLPFVRSSASMILAFSCSSQDPSEMMGLGLPSASAGAAAPSGAIEMEAPAPPAVTT